MSGGWDLNQLLGNLHSDIHQKLQAVRQTMGHPVSKGDASEGVWIELFNEYLPKRYHALKATVVDSKGRFSEQIDVVISDRQYSPFILNYRGEYVVPAESVYAVFEAKQAINADQVEYAQGKAESVRVLHRTNMPIPHAGGVISQPRPLWPILAGIVTFESDWSPALGEPLRTALATTDPNRQLDLGCVAAHGFFSLEANGNYAFDQGSKPATAFLFNLMTRLQAKATVPVIDITADAKWLAD